MTDDINDISHTSTYAKAEAAIRKDERSRLSPDIEAVCTGFVRIVCNPGPDTMRLTVQRPDECDNSFAMSREECAQLADILCRYVGEAAPPYPDLREECANLEYMKGSLEETVAKLQDAAATPRTLNSIMDSLTPERRVKIEARASELAASAAQLDDDIGILLSILHDFEEEVGETIDDTEGVVAQIESDYKARGKYGK